MSFRSISMLFLLFCFQSALWGQETADSGDQASGIAEENVDTYTLAPVTIDGVAIFSVRGISSFPAEKRAALISARIRAVAADPAFNPDSIRVVDSGDRTMVQAGAVLLFGIFDLDAAGEGVSRQLLAEIWRDKSVQAIRRYREDRNLNTILTNVFYAVLATLALAVILWLFWWGFRRVTNIIHKRVQLRVEGLEAQSYNVLQAEQIWKGLRWFLGILRGVVTVALLYFYLNLVLEFFPWTRPVARSLIGVFLTPLRALGEGLLNFLPNLVFLVILYLVTRFVLKLLRIFFGGIEEKRIHLSGFDQEWALPTFRIVRVLILVFALVVAYPYIPGSDTGAFKGISLFLGVLFSLGSTSFISNIIAGYTLIYRRAFKVGDRVKINEVVGEVIHIRLLVTHLRSIKNEEIVVPNSEILNSNVVNYSSLAAREGLILHTTVGIGYDTPWRQVEAMLLMAVERTAGLLRKPPPFVLQKQLGDFAVTYEVNAYCDDPKRYYRLLSELHRNILDVFNENGVAIMTPAYEMDPEQPKLVRREDWFLAPAVKPEKE